MRNSSSGRTRGEFRNYPQNWYFSFISFYQISPHKNNFISPNSVNKIFFFPFHVTTNPASWKKPKWKFSTGGLRGRKFQWTRNILYGPWIRNITNISIHESIFNWQNETATSEQKTLNIEMNNVVKISLGLSLNDTNRPKLDNKIFMISLISWIRIHFIQYGFRPPGKGGGIIMDA